MKIPARDHENNESVLPHSRLCMDLFKPEVVLQLEFSDQVVSGNLQKKIVQASTTIAKPNNAQYVGLKTGI